MWNCLCGKVLVDLDLHILFVLFCVSVLLAFFFSSILSVAFSTGFKARVGPSPVLSFAGVDPLILSSMMVCPLERYTQYSVKRGTGIYPQLQDNK